MAYSGRGWRGSLNMCVVEFVARKRKPICDCCSRFSIEQKIIIEHTYIYMHAHAERKDRTCWDHSTNILYTYRWLILCENPCDSCGGEYLIRPAFVYAHTWSIGQNWIWATSLCRSLIVTENFDRLHKRVRIERKRESARENRFFYQLYALHRIQAFFETPSIVWAIDGLGHLKVVFRRN